MYVFIGYSHVLKGYKCLSTLEKIFVSRNVLFNEMEFPYSTLFTKHSFVNPSSTIFDIVVLLPNSSQFPPSPFSSIFTSIASPNHNSSSPSSTEQSILSSLVPLQRPSVSVHPMVTRAKNGTFQTKGTTCMTSAISDNEPKSLKEALQSEKWMEAMKVEYTALQKNRTWKLCR
ncbi:hypothetical protein Syun_012301 [Stephania yunnanensis]|uniref:Retroviral polymerase SH3-like domain-containing protein n=1 Tax=Stephania yunnanensis TaxID=152371 RepID=A0AAP0PJC6_9MAGN